MNIIIILNYKFLIVINKMKKDYELFIEVNFDSKYFFIKTTNGVITLKKIIQESYKQFNINNALEQFIILKYNDKNGNMNIIENEKDILNNSEEISPDKYISKINLDIYPYKSSNQIIRKKIMNQHEIGKEDKPDNYLEENNKLKTQLEEIAREKDEKIKELEEKIVRMKKEFSDKLNIINQYNKDNVDRRENIIKVCENNVKENENIKKENNIQELLNKEKNKLETEILNIKKEILSVIKEELRNNKINEDINNNINIKDIIIENLNLLKKIETDIYLLKDDIKRKIYKIYEYIHPNKDKNKKNKNNDNNNYNFVIVDNNKEKIDYELNKKIQTIINDYFFEKNGKLKTTIPSDNELKNIKKEYKTFIENFNVDIEECQANFIKLTVDQEIQKIKFEEQKLVLDRKLKIINLVTDLNQEITKKKSKNKK